MKKKNRKPVESTGDFKQRIAKMMRERETGKKYSLIGAAPAHPCVVRNFRVAPKNR
jgi:hypothetical protein